MDSTITAKEFEGYFWVPAYLHVKEIEKAYQAGLAEGKRKPAEMKSYEEIEFAGNFLRWIRYGDKYINEIPVSLMQSIKDKIEKSNEVK